MATNTSYFADDELISRPEAKAKKAGALSRWFASLIAAREAKARCLVESHLAAFTDDELSTRLGYTAGQIAEVRKASQRSTPHWL